MGENKREGEGMNISLEEGTVMAILGGFSGGLLAIFRLGKKAERIEQITERLEKIIVDAESGQLKIVTLDGLEDAQRNCKAITSVEIRHIKQDILAIKKALQKIADFERWPDCGERRRGNGYVHDIG